MGHRHLDEKSRQEELCRAWGDVERDFKVESRRVFSDLRWLASETSVPEGVTLVSKFGLRSLDPW